VPAAAGADDTVGERRRFAMPIALQDDFNALRPRELAWWAK
jgi:hypothetical protein